jgi:hypothetical protein
VPTMLSRRPGRGLDGGDRPQLGRAAGGFQGPAALTYAALPDQSSVLIVCFGSAPSRTKFFSAEWLTSVQVTRTVNRATDKQISQKGNTIMKCVQHGLRSLVEAERPRYVSVKAGWARFLDYLAKRNGADIHDAGCRKEIPVLLAYVENIEDDVEPENVDAEAKLEAFGQHPDVVEAFQRFLSNGG